MGNIQSINKISFEDMKHSINNNDIIISVIPVSDQKCLIQNTTHFSNEEQIINNAYNNNELHKKIIIYGYNCNDNNIAVKYKQLVELGFNNVFIYTGGLFEWLLLQEIYGQHNFITTSYEINHLKYKPKPIFSKN